MLCLLGSAAEQASETALAALTALLGSASAEQVSETALAALLGSASAEQSSETALAALLGTAPAQNILHRTGSRALLRMDILLGRLAGLRRAQD